MASYETASVHGNLIQEFALHPSYFRPIEARYGSATSGENEAATASGLFGTKESRGKSCARPAGSDEAGQGENKETGGCG
jgi:hypothetical protein